MDPYATLGVPPDADLETIRSVYRQLARTFHPDVNADAAAVAHFREITDAFVLLSDPGQRARYDRRHTRRERAVGSETETTLGLSIAGIDLGGLVGVSVRVRTRPLFADDLEEDEKPLPPPLLPGKRRRSRSS